MIADTWYLEIEPTYVFTTDGQLRRYLQAKGLSYSRWVSRHPAAFAVLQAKPAKHSGAIG